MEELTTIETACNFRSPAQSIAYLELMAAYYFAQDGEEGAAETFEGMRRANIAAAAELEVWEESHERGPELAAYFTCEALRIRWPEIELRLPLAALSPLVPGEYMAAFVTAVRDCIYAASE